MTSVIFPFVGGWERPDESLMARLVAISYI
jgi:hypothetical protein